MNTTVSEENSFISFKIWLLSIYVMSIGMLGAYVQYKYVKHRENNFQQKYFNN